MQTKYDILIQNIKEEFKNMNNTNEIWEIPKYSKNQINKAGKTLSLPDISSKEKNEALFVLNNWRASHGYPLQEIYNILKEINPDAIVAQRLKRLDSIIGKLKSFENMSLYRMQDLGGCRVIVKDIKELYQAVEKFKKHISLNTQFELKREDDYIKKPKKSGYRSYHLVYKYHNDKNTNYNKNMLIEIQFRTKRQHTWATAVEMMSTYTQSNLKSSIGEKYLLRFFTIVSSIFAILEKEPLCPNTPQNISELLTELKALDEKHNILYNIDSLNNVSKIIQNNSKINNNDRCLLILNSRQQVTSIQTFPENEYKLAYRSFENIEKLYSQENIVLVSVSSINELGNAYPNYFLDISNFIDLLDYAIELLNNNDKNI